MKIKDIGYAVMLQQRNKEFEPTEEQLKSEGFLLFEDNTVKPANIYEFHGAFKIKNSETWVVYGHEEIKIIDEKGNEIQQEYTR